MHFYYLNIKEVLFQVSSYHTDQKRHLGLIRLPTRAFGYLNALGIGCEWPFRT